MLIGEAIIYLGLILALGVSLTRIFFMLIKGEFKLYLFLMKIVLGLLLAGGISLLTGRLLGF